MLKHRLNENRRVVGRRKKNVEIQCYLMLALPIIGFFVFTLYPMLWAAIKSLYYYTGIPNDTKFVGLKNFFTVMTKDAMYWKTWIATFKMAIYKLPFEIPLALVLAALLGRNRKGAGFFRGFYYMPCVVSVAIIGLIFSNIFDYFGFINRVLVDSGIVKERIDWFASTNTAFVALVAGSVWSSFGINVLYFSAALTNVPEELYEAAEIDGAGGVRKFINITVPMIAPVFQTVLLLAINGTLHIGEYILVMSGGAPGGTTNTVGSFMIQQYLPGFVVGIPDLGYGCARSIITSVIYGVVALIYNKLSSKLQNV